MPGYDKMFEKDGKQLSWNWASKRLRTSHNYWIASSRPDGRPHLMPVWGIWLDDMFYFSTGRFSRKSRNLVSNPNCVVCPESAAEAVILEGQVRKVKDTDTLRRFGAAYEKKYNWDMGDLVASKDPVYRVQPRTVFGFVENSKKVRGNPTRWRFAKERNR